MLYTLEKAAQSFFNISTKSNDNTALLDRCMTE